MRNDLADDLALSVPLWKRALDVICVAWASPVLIPVFVLIGFVIKSVSPGPMFFLQERIGYRGRRFLCFKFRTMKVNADAAVHRRHLEELMRHNRPLTKMDSQGDTRLIPLGRLLRASGLDELPQILNVLAGQMSLVGPRPCLPYEYEMYSPVQKQRFNTLPGLTGLWQVSGKNETTFSEMMALDLAYVEKRTVWLDLRILLKTVPVLCSQVRGTSRPKAAREWPALNVSKLIPAVLGKRLPSPAALRQPHWVTCGGKSVQGEEPG